MATIFPTRARRRGPRRPGMPSLFPQGARRAPRPGLLGVDDAPFASELEIAIILGQDPREYLR